MSENVSGEEQYFASNYVIEVNLQSIVVTVCTT